MQQDGDGRYLKCFRRSALAIIASAAVAAPAAYAWEAKNLILVPPAELPQLARQSGEAMFLHQTVDGRTLLYVEHHQGTQLAIFDVTDPGRLKQQGTVQLDAAGPFDFISALGENAELVHFRQSQANAVLDLHRAKAPTLRKIEGLTLQGQTIALGGDGFTVSTPVDAGTQPARDYQIVDSANSLQLKRAYDMKQVREEISNHDTGTTFLLAESGLYLIRRPAVEWNRQLRELDTAN
jgi:hypothetical protein